MIAHIYDVFQATVATGNPAVIIGLAFIVGLVTSFTPCLYPMIPITMGILQSQATKSAWSNFLTAFSYIMGMAVVYAVLGYVAATSSMLFGRWASNPWVILFVVMVFLYLAFSMFGFYEVRLPAFLTNRSVGDQVDNQQGESHKGGNLRGLVKSFFFGIISGTIASPCLTPPLAIILALVAKKGSPVVGITALFAFALGMGMLLLVIGTVSSSLALLPRAGYWMDEVKKFFGFVMLAVCVYIAGPVIGDTISQYLYWGVGIVTLGYYIIGFFRKIVQTRAHK